MKNTFAHVNHDLLFAYTHLKQLLKTFSARWMVNKRQMHLADIPHLCNSINHNMKIATKLIHAGAEPDPSTGAIMTPIYQTSTYVQAAPGQHKGFEYARSQNPTRKALEEAFAIIENGQYGLAFSSGVAATDAVIKLLEPGDEIIAANDMYGGTYRLFTKIFEKFGLKFHYVDMHSADNIKPYINSRTKLIWAETPTNPLMNIVDIARLPTLPKPIRYWYVLTTPLLHPTCKTRWTWVLIS